MPFYKYRTVNCFTKKILLKDEIYFASPFTFNDPFDCRLNVYWQASESLLQSKIRSLAAQVPELEEHLQNQTLEEFVMNEGIHKDHNMMLDISRKAIDQNLKNIGVFCLTTKCDDILMWSHYANGHKGLCLKFEDNFYQNPPQEVKYPQSPPKIKFTGTSRSWVNQLLLTKFATWKYEKEWRIIEQNTGSRKFNGENLTGVILGCQINNKHKKKILKWLSKRKTEVSIYEARRKDDQFSLDIVELSSIR